jgi:hypothetical protein
MMIAKIKPSWNVLRRQEENFDHHRIRHTRDDSHECEHKKDVDNDEDKVHNATRDVV